MEIPVEARTREARRVNPRELISLTPMIAVNWKRTTLSDLGRVPICHLPPHGTHLVGIPRWRVSRRGRGGGKRPASRSPPEPRLPCGAAGQRYATPTVVSRPIYKYILRALCVRVRLSLHLYVSTDTSERAYVARRDSRYVNSLATPPFPAGWSILPSER